jgi:hypothetical protein
MSGFARTFLIALAVTTRAASACQGQIQAAPVIEVDYDSFSAVPAIANAAVTVLNTGADPCAATLFVAQTKALGQLQTFVYELRGENVNPSLNNEPDGMQLAQVNLASGQSKTVPLQILVPRGQFAVPGLYSFDLTFFLRNETHEGSQHSHRKAQLRFRVRPIFNLYIAGGGLKEKLDFQTLEPGQSRTVILHAEANQSYALTISSKNNGVLALDPSIAGQTWTIPYELRCDGHTLLLNPAVFSGCWSDVMNGRQTHILQVQIGAFSNKRAGLYRDTLMIEIKPRL